jgi:signal transduction histidine kinase
VPHLFDRYRSGANPEGLPTSTGIGLWLSRELARLMGGDLRWVGNGQGAAFELTLPATGGGQCAIEPSPLAEQAVGF